MVACFECGKPAEFNHHVVPQSKGGTRTVPLCVQCHGKVHDKRMVSISTLTKASMATKRKRNERISRHVPYGWDLGADGRLLVNLVEQAIIRVMRRWRLEGWSYRAIAAQLDEDGIATKRGGRWMFGSVKSILTRAA